MGLPRFVTSYGQATNPIQRRVVEDTTAVDNQASSESTSCDPAKATDTVD